MGRTTDGTELARFLLITRKSLSINDLGAPGARKGLALNNLRRKYLARFVNLTILGLARRLLALQKIN